MIVCELCVGDHLGPQGGVCTTEDAEICFNLLVNTFSFSVRLGMVGCGEGEVISKCFPELCYILPLLFSFTIYLDLLMFL